MKPRTRKAHLGYHAENVRVTADGPWLYFRIRNSRQQTRGIAIGEPLAPVPIQDDPRQLPLLEYNTKS
jgi:hypothetical protein